MAIIFYDLLSTLPHKAFSPNTWKTRYCLNFKGIPYRTEWVDFIEIEGVYKKLGLVPSSYKPDGSPTYLLPVIHDISTGVSVADSLLIAEYLEKTYPVPSLFPNNTIAFQSIFDNAVRDAALKPQRRFTIPDIFSVVSLQSKDYFRRTREAAFGKPLEEIAPQGDEAVAEWAVVKAGWGTIDSWYIKSGGPFILGDTVSWADFVVGSWLIWARTIWGEESQKWKDYASWHNGRWLKVLDDLKEYQRID
ncbi:hypothetical protein HYPSUDRAFT_189028 [Hypholoma sublateritium FD-334 SS-4]|uniref:GST N-terminal domain-containing protein n=1 Tax=Hypholoma sublateritium (strain FD-334 SS-4) TaxID=945553 RepID=A0A0D2NN77_HYPSF|nr:hypothetical protein HYPSUDRAFT_189028 [Hypholoma sublateritium FD-334 SS-4]